MIGPPVIPDETSTTSTSFLRKLRKSDPAAWCRLVKHYTGRVHRWARDKGLKHDDAKDVSQDAFLAVLSNIGKFKRRKLGSFRRWLRVITMRKAIDRKRTARKTPGIGGGGSDHRRQIEAVANPIAESCVVDSCYDETENQQIPVTDDVLAAMAMVKSRAKRENWEIFELFAQDDLSTHEIASQFDVTVEHVYMVKSRIAGRIRVQVEKQQSGQIKDD